MDGTFLNRSMKSINISSATIVATVLLGVVSWFSGCAHRVVQSELISLDKEMIEAIARSQILESDPYVEIEDYRLLSISSVFPSDDVVDQQEVILVRFLVEGTRKEEIISEESFMGHPVGTRTVSWATVNILMDGSGKPLEEEAPIRKYMVPSPLYEEVAKP